MAKPAGVTHRPERQEFVVGAGPAACRTEHIRPPRQRHGQDQASLILMSAEGEYLALPSTHSHSWAAATACSCGAHGNDVLDVTTAT